MKLLPAPTPELAALRVERLAKFKHRWKAHRDIGYVDLVRKRDGQRRLVEMVQADLAEALWPTSYWHPSPPLKGGGLPGPMNHHPLDAVTPEQIEDWTNEDPFLRTALSYSTRAHLAYISSFKPRTRP